MQVVFKNENEKSSSKGTNSVGAVLYTKKISRCLEEKYFGRFRSRKFGV